MFWLYQLLVAIASALAIFFDWLRNSRPGRLREAVEFILSLLGM